MRAPRRAGTALAAALLAVTAACSTTTDGQPYGSAGSGSGSAPGPTGSPGTHHGAQQGAPTLRTMWTAKIDGAVGGDQQLTDVTSDGRNAYASDVSGRVWSLDGATGKVLWAVRPGERSGVGPMYAASRVFFNDSDKGLYALDPRTGRTVWRARSGWITATHTIIVPAVRSIVVLPSYSGGLVGVRATTGAKVWGSQRIQSPDYAAADSRAVYVASGSDEATAKVQALRPTTGAIEWTWSAALSGHASVLVYALSGVVLVLTVDSSNDTTDTLTALDPTTGKVRWTTRTTGIQGDYPPAAIDGVIAFGGLKGTRGFDASSGKLLFTVAGDHGPTDGVVPCDGAFCDMSLATITALDPTGKQVASMPVPEDALGLATTSSGPVFAFGSGTVNRVSS